jgi:hypothetical protein
MSNWGTAVQNVTERIHRYGTSDPDIVKRALSEAIKRYANHNFWFNQGTYDFSTADGTYAYGTETTAGAADGYPSDMLKPIKLTLQVSSAWYDINTVSIDYFRDKFIDSSYKGFPEKWCWFNKEILLFPTPNGVYTVKIDYCKDIGIPAASYASSTWTFTDSVTGAAMADATTSGWFTEGFDLITARAVYIIASQTLGNQELAIMAKQLEAEQLEELHIDSEASHTSPYPRPWT